MPSVSIPDMPHITAMFDQFIAKEKGLLAMYMSIICVVALERIAVPHIYGKLLAAIKKMERVKVYFVALVVLFTVFQLLEIWVTVIDARLVPSFESFVRENVVDEVITRHKLQYAELDLGDLTSKLIKLPSYMRDVFYRAKAFLLFHVLTAVTTGAYLFYCHWSLGLVFSFVALVLAAGSWSFARHCKRSSYEREEAFDHTQESIQDVLANLLAVYNSQNEAGEQLRVQRLNANLNHKVQKSVHCGIPYRILFAVAFLVLFAGITGLGIYLYHTGRIELDLFVSSFIITFAMLKTCMSIYYDMDSLVYLKGGLQVVEDFLDGLPKKSADCEGSTEPTQRPTRRIRLRPMEGVAVRFDRVSFWYGSLNAPPALDRLSLHIPAGQRVAIRGGVGSGKSTMSHLLMRLQCQQKGAVFVNGIDTRGLDISSLRSAVHYVGQHPRLFNRTLWENLSYGNSELKSEEQVYELLQSLQMVGVARVFRALMHEPVGKNGSRLSGGQRQVAWVLRGMLTPSNAIILDEPTASMDDRTRDQVMKLITGLAGSRTTIIITHDPALLRIASRVVTLEGGRLTLDSNLPAR